MNRTMGLVLMGLMLVIFSSSVLADGCKEPIEFAIDNDCDLRKVGGIVNKYLCGDDFIYADCEGEVYKRDSTIIGRLAGSESEEKKFNPIFLIVLIMVEIFLVAVSIIIIVAVVKKRRDKEE